MNAVKNTWDGEEIPDTRLLTMAHVDKLEDLFPEDEYNKRLDRFRYMYGRPPKYCDHPTFLARLRKAVTDWWTTRMDSTYCVTSPGVCFMDTGCVPVLFCKDVLEPTRVMSCVFDELLGEDVAAFWSQGSQSPEWAQCGTPMRVCTTLPRRFTKHKPDRVVLSMLASEVQAKSVAYTPMAQAYWRSKGIPFIGSNDVQDLATAGFDAFYGIEVFRNDDRGFGVFSEHEDYLYWDFSRHGGANAVGNMILVEGFALAKSLNKPLNLGIDFYPWKKLWGNEVKYTKTVNIKPDTAEIALLNQFPVRHNYVEHH